MGDGNHGRVDSRMPPSKLEFFVYPQQSIHGGPIPVKNPLRYASPLNASELRHVAVPYEKWTMKTARGLVAARFVDVRLPGSLVLRHEVLVCVSLLDQPVGEFGDLLAQVGDRLLVHVRLSDELREGDCGGAVLLVVCPMCFVMENEDGREREGK